jgi:hypothetical protein
LKFSTCVLVEVGTVVGEDGTMAESEGLVVLAVDETEVLLTEGVSELGVADGDGVAAHPPMRMLRKSAPTPGTTPLRIAEL